MTYSGFLTPALILGYILVIFGSIGMVVFAIRFPFSTNIQDLKLTNSRFAGLNGHQVWVGSWGLIVVGTVIQLFASVSLTQGSLGDSPSGPPGRFILLTAQRTAGDQTVVPVIVRMDSRTGETWLLDLGEPRKWVGVQDSLRPVGKYNPTTKKVEWGVQLPDGRYLKDLSKDELVRHLETLIMGTKEGGHKLEKSGAGAKE